MNILMQLIGRLHPIVVHLPIGFIIFGFIIYLYDRKSNQLTKVISWSFLWGGISAVIACVSGYLLYQTEGFAFGTVKLHLWLGILTAIFCFIVYTRIRKPLPFLNKIKPIAFYLFSIMLISYTGHLGGSITHGEEYLLEPLPNGIKRTLGITVYEEQEIALNRESWEEIELYTEVIHPILNNKCLSCHNTKKSKGDLMLQSPEVILKGGESGSILTPENPEQSDLYTRLILPEHDDNHMPPEGKTQLTKEEIRIIFEWIKNGAHFDKTSSELGIQKEVLETFFEKKKNNYFPDKSIEPVLQHFVDSVETIGVHAEKISGESNYLSVSSINQPNFNDSSINALKPIAKHIAILDLGNTKITDEVFDQLKGLPSLTVLKLDNTSITGKGIGVLKACTNLKKINLVNTQFESDYINDFDNFKRLQKIYIHNSKVNISELNIDFDSKHFKIDFGNYDLPLIEADSIVY